MLFIKNLDFPHQVMNKVKDGGFIMKQPPQASDFIYSMMRHCWQSDPAKVSIFKFDPPSRGYTGKVTKLGQV